MKPKLIAAVVIFILVIAGFVFVMKSRTKTPSKLKVESEPAANVFLNEKPLGKTPYESTAPVGDYQLKLVPMESSDQVETWESKITLASSLLTYIKRDLGPSSTQSAGEILFFEKTSKQMPQLSVISSPDGAFVLIDGQERGHAPLSIDEILPGEHDVAVELTGFTARSIRVNLIEGYKLNVSFQLKMAQGTVQPGSSNSSAATPTQGTSSSGSASSTSSGPKVTVKDTPTGFLRVREEPSLNATESAQVKPGDSFSLVEEKDGWYKIEFKPSTFGWISARYANKK